MKRMLAAAALFAVAPALSAQTPAHDPSAKLREVLPVEVADQVIRKIVDAHSRRLPSQALAHRALELAAKGAPPADIPGNIDAWIDALDASRNALVEGGRSAPSDGEIEAAGTAMSRGVSDVEVSDLAKSAPSGRSLEVPMFVISSLVDRGLPSDQAIAMIQARLQAHTSDADLGALAQPRAPLGEGIPAAAGGDLTGVRSPSAVGPPTSGPVNAGRRGKPETPGKPSTPGG